MRGRSSFDDDPHAFRAREGRSSPLRNVGAVAWAHFERCPTSLSIVRRGPGCNNCVIRFRMEDHQGTGSTGRIPILDAPTRSRRAAA